MGAPNGTDEWQIHRWPFLEQKHKKMPHEDFKQKILDHLATKKIPKNRQFCRGLYDWNTSILRLSAGTNVTPGGSEPDFTRA